VKILLLTASVGSGHTRAAEAVSLALREAHPGVRVETLDALTLASPLFRAFYGKGYLALAERAPALVGWFYDRLDEPRAPGDWARQLVQTAGMKALLSRLREGEWDAIVSTHFLTSELVAALKRRALVSAPLVTIVTDMDAHRLWAQEPCTKYLVGGAEAANALQRRGVAGERIAITGIPIHPIFSRLPTRRACLAEHGLSGTRPVILQLAGGSGHGPLEDVYTGLLSLEKPVDLIVVAGRNRAARYRLLKRLVPARHNARVLGFTDRMHELMRAADLVVSKPGGLTCSEALACGTPMAIINPIPGQESRNGDFLLENGAAIKINAVAALPGKVAALLEDPLKLARLRESALKLASPVAAFDAAREIVSVAERAARSERGTAAVSA